MVDELSLTDIVVTLPPERVERPQKFTPEEAIGDTGITDERIVDQWLEAWTQNAFGCHRLVDQDRANLRLLKGKHLDEVAVVVSTGPSLDRNIAELKRLDRSKFRILSTTSALNPLLANGIVPDYAGMNDGAPWVADLHYAELEKSPVRERLADVGLILATTCHPSTATRWPGRLYWYNDDCDVVSLMAKDGALKIVYKFLPNIPVAGCSTNTLVLVAVLMGFRRVALIGTDLAFSGRSAHCTKYKRVSALEPPAPGAIWDAAALTWWTPTAINEEFFLKKAHWIFRGCPRGCTLVVNRWTPSEPIEPTWGEMQKCETCRSEMQHVPTSGEYLFYMVKTAQLAQQKKYAIDLDNERVEREVDVVNATGGGALFMPTMIRQMALADILAEAPRE